MSPRWTVHGYAIVSADDRIADADGHMPDALRNEADWRMFQSELDRMDAIALGRRSHEATPNRHGRTRIVLSSSLPALERRADAWWWNPSGMATADMLATVFPQGGAVGVPGGRDVFDLFLGFGYASFHLSRAERARLPGGVAVFGACDRGMSAEEVLRASGLAPGQPVILDAENSVSLTVFVPTNPARQAASAGL